MIDVLIVEDEKKFHQFYIDVLSGFNKNIDIITVLTGEEALSVLKHKRIDGIFIDLQLPGMNGFELANKIRRIEKYHYLPIVFATGLDFDTLETYKKHRNFDYILKPFSREAFEKVAAHFIEEVETFKTCIPEKEERELFFQHDDGVSRIKFSDILFASTSRNRRMKLVTYDKEYYKSNISFDHFVAFIGDDMFVRCFKSFAVNITNIKEIITVSHKSWDITFRDAPEHVCQLSQKYRKNVEELFKEYQVNNMEKKNNE